MIPLGSSCEGAPYDIGDHVSVPCPGSGGSCTGMYDQVAVSLVLSYGCFELSGGRVQSQIPSPSGRGSRPSLAGVWGFPQHG